MRPVYARTSTATVTHCGGGGTSRSEPEVHSASELAGHIVSAFKLFQAFHAAFRHTYGPGMYVARASVILSRQINRCILNADEVIMVARSKAQALTARNPLMDYWTPRPLCRRSLRSSACSPGVIY